MTKLLSTLVLAAAAMISVNAQAAAHAGAAPAAKASEPAKKASEPAKKASEPAKKAAAKKEAEKK